MATHIEEFIDDDDDGDSYGGNHSTNNDCLYIKMLAEVKPSNISAMSELISGATLWYKLEIEEARLYKIKLEKF